MQSEQKPPKVVIGLLTLNGETWLPSLLDSLKSQQGDFTLSFEAIDSSSKDATTDILKQYEIPYRVISKNDFSHSVTRNELATLAGEDCDYLLFISQDALPRSNLMVQRLLEILTNDTSIKAVCAVECQKLQDPFSVCGVARNWIRNFNSHSTYIMRQQEILQVRPLTPKRLVKLHAFTNVCALYDRRYLINNQFDTSVSFGEDLHFAHRTLLNGDAVAATSCAVVQHSFAHTKEERKQKLKKCQELHREVFGLTPEKPLKKVIRWMGDRWIET